MGDVGAPYGPLIVLATSRPLPDVMDLPLDYRDLPPLPAHILERVKQDEARSFTGDTYGVPKPGPPPSRVVPKRRFVKGQDPITKLRVWVERRIYWVDEAIK